MTDNCIVFMMAGLIYGFILGGLMLAVSGQPMTADFSTGISVLSLAISLGAIWQAKRYNCDTSKMLIEQRAILAETKDTLKKISEMYESLKAETERLESVKIEIGQARSAAWAARYS